MGWIIAAAQLFLGRAVWVRRWTLSALSDQAKLTERTITVSLLLQLAGLFLMSPLSAATVGHVLHAVCGHWNLDAWAGHGCYMGAVGMFGVSVGSRLDISSNQLRWAYKRYVERPTTIVAPITLALLVESPSADKPWPDLFDCPTDYWMDAYWTLLCAFFIFVLVNITRVLVILRRDPRNRSTATVYIAASVAAIVACAAHAVTTWTDDNYGHWFWIAGSGVAVVFGYAASRSWRLKLRRMIGTRL